MAADIQQQQNAGNSRENSAAAALFQRAHQKMLTLSRIDEQLATLIDQRRKVQDELKTVQAMINEEFDRFTRAMAELPATVVTSISESVRAHSHGGPRIQQAEEAAA
jgi:hypothetical protein